MNQPPVRIPVHILNGPSLDALGRREPGVYGNGTLDDIRELCEKEAAGLGVCLTFRQTNHEGQLIDWCHEAGGHAAALVINPAGLGHTSIALMDALLAVSVPVIELHLSNIYRREAFRHHSWVSRAATGIIAGLGPPGYPLAIRAALALLPDGHPESTAPV